MSEVYASCEFGFAFGRCVTYDYILRMLAQSRQEGVQLRRIVVLRRVLITRQMGEVEA
jgi:hypothetical protein